MYVGNPKIIYRFKILRLKTYFLNFFPEEVKNLENFFPLLRLGKAKARLNGKDVILIIVVAICDLLFSLELAEGDHN